MKFDFSTANRVLFGTGISDQLESLVKGWGRRCLIIHRPGSAEAERITNQLEKIGLEITCFPVRFEPTYDLIQQAVALAKQVQAQFVIAIGGGSVMDTGKAASALAVNPGELLDYLEVVGAGQPILNPALPLVAMPTTSGTGSEVTRNAVIEVTEKNVKVSLRSNFLLPRIALVDPELTVSMPKEITAYSGMDALTQLIEPFVSLKSNWMIDSLCRDGITKAASELVTAYDQPNNLFAREGMSYAAMLSGMALANAGLGAVHGFAGPIGGMYDAPHGAICARLLPAVVKMNIKVLNTRAPNPEVLDKFKIIAQLLTGRDQAEAEDGVLWLENLRSYLMIPALSDYGISPDAYDLIVEKSLTASSMKGNPVALTREELKEILVNSS